jgi:hypothetical protein
MAGTQAAKMWELCHKTADNSRSYPSSQRYIINYAYTSAMKYIYMVGTVDDGLPHLIIGVI